MHKLFYILFFVAYQLLQLLVLPFVVLYLVFRRLKGKSIGSLKQRCGFVPTVTHKNKGLWIHAVSVGEVAAIEYLVDHYKQKHPHNPCYLTTGTAGGLQTASRMRADYISLLPFDFLLPMLIAFMRIRPQKIILVEAEMWPNLLMLAYLFKIPVILLNGRINQASAQKRKYMGFLYHLCSKIFALTTADAQHFEQFGIPSASLHVTGDIKAWNIAQKKAALESAGWRSMALDMPYPILLAGSVHPGECDTVLQAYMQARRTIPSLKLILVPRHFTWMNELHKKCSAHAYTLSCWNEQTPLTITPQGLQDALFKALDTNDCLVVQRLGVLFFLYSYASVYYLGGTFVPIGGHNMLEPAIWALPCVSGPHLHKCAAIAPELRAAGGLLIANTPNELGSHLVAYLATKKYIPTGLANYDILKQKAHNVDPVIHTIIE